jgi:hypothetical protein
VRDLDAPRCRRGRVEDHCCIDVCVLRKTGKLEPGAFGVWCWSRGTSIVGAVNLAGDAYAIEIDGYVVADAEIVPVGR